MNKQYQHLNQFHNQQYFQSQLSHQLESLSFNKKMNQSEQFNQKKMKQLVQQMRFKEKMEVINRKKGRYKRSTNNCHKKYIGILKNLLFLKLNHSLKNQILTQFTQYKNSRVYYFIVLCYLKWYLSGSQIRWIFQHFCKSVQSKIARYLLEVQTTSNANFINFRKDQIVEMQYSIHSINYFLRGNVEESIKMLYQKNKYIIIKRNEYLRTCHIIETLEKTLEGKVIGRNPQEQLSKLNLQEVYPWKNENITEEKTKNKGNHGHEQMHERFKEYQPVHEEYSSEDQKIQHDQPGLNCLEKEVKMEQNREYHHISPSMPLLGLENSYPMISEVNWFNWIDTKRKEMQMYLKFKEESLNRIYASYTINSHEHPLFSFPLHDQ